MAVRSISDMPKLDPQQLMVRCPHLLIWGTRDTALLEASTEGLEEVAPGLTRMEFQDADHWICHQKPAEVAEALLHWYDGLTR